MKKTSDLVAPSATLYPDMPEAHKRVRLHQTDVNWQPPDSMIIQDANLANWLLDNSSLTERLQRLCDDFKVVVVSHQLKSPKVDEIALLNCAEDTTYVREVLLLGNGIPWVYARSVIPAIINDGELTGLGSEPLGKRIFNDSRFKRGAFQMCQLEWASIKQKLIDKTYVDLSAINDERAPKVYGRRSCFDFLGCKMSVAELFLPDAPAYSNAR